MTRPTYNPPRRRDPINREPWRNGGETDRNSPAQQRTEEFITRDQAFVQALIREGVRLGLGK